MNFFAQLAKNMSIVVNLCSIFLLLLILYFTQTNKIGCVRELFFLMMHVVAAMANIQIGYLFLIQ